MCLACDIRKAIKRRIKADGIGPERAVGYCLTVAAEIIKDCGAERMGAVSASLEYFLEQCGCKDVKVGIGHAEAEVPPSGQTRH